MNNIPGHKEMQTFSYNNLVSVFDASKVAQFGLQDPASSGMEAIVYFHNSIMVLLTLIIVGVFFLMKTCLDLYSYENMKSLASEVLNPKDKVHLGVYFRKVNLMFTHSTRLEVIWTVVPALLLVLVAIPSFALLYSMEEFVRPDLTLKVIGHQWYWSYEFPHIVGEYAEGEEVDVNEEEWTPWAYDSYMLSEEDVTIGQYRLLEVDRRVVLPTNTHIRVLVTAADVLHCWAVPALGIKVDACPGRLNQTNVFIKREGVFYGQCSEICGVNHGFMPICVRAVDRNTYYNDYCGKHLNQDSVQWA